MGKMLLIFIAAASVGGTLMLSQRMGTERVDTERKTLDEAQMLAREITESAYSLGVSRVQASFHERPLNGDVAYEGITFGEGDYDLYIIKLPCGAMRVTATGRMTVPVADGSASTTTKTHTMQGDFVALAEMPGAVLVDAAVTSTVNVTFDDTATISGVDRRPACEKVLEESWDYCTSFATIRSGMGGTKPQVVTNNNVLKALGASGTESAMSSTSPVTTFPAYVQDIYDDAYALATSGATEDYIHSYSSDKEFNSEHTFGSPSEPVVMFVDGDVRFTGPTTGYGVMIVHGDFEADNNFTWGGVIYVKKAGALNVRLGGDARVFGSFAVQNPDNGSGTSGPLDLRLEDEAGIYYSAESIALLSDMMDRVAANTKVELINERHTPATVFPQLECPGPDDDPIVVPDPPCDCQNGKTAVMHFPRNGNKQLICISPNAVPAHTDAPHHWATTGESDYVVCTSS